MENKLEQLLNSLIEKGWKPFGKTGINERDAFVYMNKGHCIRLHKGVYAGNILCGEYDLRQIVSKESGLWQFVCENGMIYSTPDDRGGPNYNWLEDLFNCGWKHPDYWLMESALCDEYKLENFLLSNIKVEGQQKN